MGTGLFVLMAVIFTLTFIPDNPPAWLPYLRAFTEAAMVGALADWFAVTALFRHPFGIPIPHTAIVPNNKDQIGSSLAGFVETNFLTREVLAPKLKDVNFSTGIGVWMERPDNARALSENAGGLLIWLLESVDNDTVKRFLEKNLRSGSSSLQITPLLSQLLRLFTADGRHQELMDAAVRIARQQLIENRYIIRDRINQQSPWWLPKFVDEEIYTKIIGEIARLLDRIGDDPGHAARISFNQATDDLIDSMANDPDTIERGESIKGDILNHPSVNKYITQSWEDIKSYITEQSNTEDSELRVRLEKAISRLGIALQNDSAMQKQVNDWVELALLHLVGRYRGSVVSVISDTVESWDTDVTTRRVELQVGRDLQFIRINGTLVGGLVGLIIYSLVKALS